MAEIRRIVSFLPSATEMVCALGLGEQLIGVTHACDYPPEIEGKTIVVRSAIPIETMNQAEIDAAVTQRLREGQSLYLVDETLVQEIAPDLIVTQDLCQVCAPSGNEVSQLLDRLSSKPQIVWLTPKCVGEIFENLRDLGNATGRSQVAEALIAGGRARLDLIENRARAATSRPSVFCMEWIDPVYCSGHWVPEMVRMAGGIDKLGREGADTVRVLWDDVLQWKPEVLVVMPCGYDLEGASALGQQLYSQPGWASLPAVRNSRVYAVDANSYFARPGPRIIEGTELLAHLIHPDLFNWNGRTDAFRSLGAVGVS
jgi:iron complex transport system substrate-binding protein